MLTHKEVQRKERAKTTEKLLRTKVNIIFLLAY